MTMAEPERIAKLYFGFERERLLLRFDAHGSTSQRLADVETLRIVFLEPAGFELLVAASFGRAGRTCSCFTTTCR